MTVQISDFRPATDCTCNYLACVCNVRRNHKKKCKFRRAVECPVSVPCEHGRDVCPECDPCTCDKRTPLKKLK